MTFHYERRLGRAIYHLECLETEIDLWLEEGPYRIWAEPDVDSTKEILWAEILKPPPTAELSLIIGDCLHNLRSALDNLAFELAVTYKKGWVKSIEGDSGFPIFSKENPSKFNDMLRGVHPGAKAIIEDLQPYNRGIRTTNDPLWQLNKLAIEDKHRLPHVTPFTSITLLSVMISHSQGVDAIEPINFTVEDRAPIARYPTVDQTGAKVDVNLTPTFSVGFGQRAPKQLRGFSIPDRLRRIHRYITEWVVPPLACYLD